MPSSQCFRRQNVDVCRFFNSTCSLVSYFQSIHYWHFGSSGNGCYFSPPAHNLLINQGVLLPNVTIWIFFVLGGYNFCYFVIVFFSSVFNWNRQFYSGNPRRQQISVEMTIKWKCFPISTYFQTLLVCLYCLFFNHPHASQMVTICPSNIYYYTIPYSTILYHTILYSTIFYYMHC